MAFVDTVFDLNHAQAMPWLTLYNVYGPAFFTQGERFISCHYGTFLAHWYVVAM